MARAIDVADYIIFKANELGRPISNLELQKYMYFCNARALIEPPHLPLIEDESMGKWKYGPVAPSAYHTYKRYGINRISTPDTQVSLNTTTWEVEVKVFDSNTLEEAERKLIDDTIPHLFGYDRFELVDITHKHPSWLREEKEIMAGVQGIQYTNEEIRNDFNENPEFQIWDNK